MISLLPKRLKGECLYIVDLNSILIRYFFEGVGPTVGVFNGPGRAGLPNQIRLAARFGPGL